MTGLSTKEQERAIREATLVWHLRNKKDASDEQIAERLEYGSVEALRRQLKNWGLPDWVLGEESETNRAKEKGRKKSAPLVRDLGPAKGLPPAGNAIPLFKERLEALLESAELLEHMDEDLRGKYFVRTNVTPESFAQHLSTIKGYAEEEGGDLGEDFEACLYYNINVGEAREAALDEAKRFLDAYYYTDYDRERLKRWVAHGSPEECVEQIQAFIEAGATTVTLRMAAYDQKAQFERVSREVLPALEAALA